MIVKIDRSTIKPNPYAGATSFQVSGPWQGSFEIKGEYPRFMQDDDRFVVRSWQPGKYYNGSILSPDALEVLQDPENVQWFKNNNAELSYEANKNIHTYGCMPQAEYLYEHENPVVICEECSTEVHVNDIESDVFDTGDGEVYYVDEICPKCKAHESFGKLEYESIQDALKTIIV